MPPVNGFRFKQATKWPLRYAVLHYWLQINTKRSISHFCWWNVYEDTLIILVFVWRKSINFDEDMHGKPFLIFSFPINLDFRPLTFRS